MKSTIIVLSVYLIIGVVVRIARTETPAMDLFIAPPKITILLWPFILIKLIYKYRKD